MRQVALGGHIDVLTVNLQFEIRIGNVLLCHRNVAADVLPGFLEEQWNRLRCRPRPSTSPLLSVYRHTCGAQQEKTQCPCKPLQVHHASTRYSDVDDTPDEGSPQGHARLLNAV